MSEAAQAVRAASPAREPGAITWRAVRESLARPFPATIPLLALVLLVPLYIFIPGMVRGWTLHVPAVALDDALPLLPAWSFVYAAFYAFLILMPVFIVREADHVRRTIFAYLTVWIISYAFFVMYPTIASRPRHVIGGGFAAWGLRQLYSMDTPYNCFPSIHVAHSFVSALTCWRVHRGIGIIAVISAALVALSTLFTKQHYIADVIAGVLLAGLAYMVFLRNTPRNSVPKLDRRLAPVFAAGIWGLIGLWIAGFWIAYKFDR